MSAQPPDPLPFDDSRRLTGYNLYFADVGAVLETVGVAVDAALLREWETRVRRMRGELGWQDGAVVARAHASGASLAFAAPLDQLFTATEVNEWAWMSTLLPFSLREKKAAGRMREEHHTTTRISNSDALPSPQPLSQGERGSTLPPVPASFSLREKVPEGRMREDHHTTAHTSNSDTFPSPQPLSRGERGFKLPFDDEVLAFVRSLRQSATDAEQLMWFLLRDRRLRGQEFRRQYAIGPYILDFHCHELQLAIEIDGGQHNESSILASEARRDAFMSEHGIRTMRFWNHDVLQRTEEVLSDIWHAVEEHLTGKYGVPSPPGRGAGVREELHAPGHAAAWDENSALHTLQACARAERNPALTALATAGHTHGLTVLIDDESLSLGVGRGSRVFALTGLPLPADVDWSALHEAPIALVTGSNGKTTTVRLLAAFARAHGWHSGHSCTDGLFVDDVAIAAGDYSGPAGARAVLRHPSVEAAILETARGGILRRGIAVQRADVAVVTNISADHFGEYGVHDLDDLTAVKLAVARTLQRGGTLVLNADDENLVRRAGDVDTRRAWFALDADAHLLRAHRTSGGITCGARAGHLHLQIGQTDHDLGAIAAMPLSFNGAAQYNIANIAAAALAAHALGIAPATLAKVLATFGSARADNPGRLQHWSFGGIEVFVDYAHNPDGLRGLLEVATRTRQGRLGLLLGQAGNREDAEIRELAAVAAAFVPESIVLKDIAAMLRGRAAGEVPAILRYELERQAIAADRISDCLDEYAAVRAMLLWSRAGDTLVLPIHGTEVKPRVADLLDHLQASGWQSGTPLPEL